MEQISIEQLKKDSGLPGPRGNLELLSKFLRCCNQESVNLCLAELREDTRNSPEEFVGMCGVVGHALLNWKSRDELLRHLRNYASHQSWRIRESVAIAIQEIPFASLEDRIKMTEELETGDPFIHRAIVAGLCEPKNLKKQQGSERLFGHLVRATNVLDKTGKTSEGEDSLKKALGYCWSVALAEFFDEGKAAFGRIVTSTNKNLNWIARENLKKSRLIRKNRDWVEDQFKQLTG
jgi:hypothetical protein